MAVADRPPSCEQDVLCCAIDSDNATAGEKFDVLFAVKSGRAKIESFAGDLPIEIGLRKRRPLIGMPFLFANQQYRASVAPGHVGMPRVEIPLVPLQPRQLYPARSSSGPCRGSVAISASAALTIIRCFIICEGEVGEPDKALGCACLWNMDYRRVTTSPCGQISGACSTTSPSRLSCMRI